MLSAAEKTIFQAFVNFCPNFAGARVKCEEGPNPPDYICTDETGRRIGVELGEWLDEQQMKRSKERERLEESYCSVLRSEDQDPPRNIEWVCLYEKSGRRLPATDAALFKTEVYRCVSEIDASWPTNPDRDAPQGHSLSDFSKYPLLGKYLAGLEFRSRRRLDRLKGISWIGFRPQGGAYSPKDAVESLLRLLEKKANKYAGLHEDHQLSELYLIAYYDQALAYNTPYFGSNFGLAQVAEIAAIESSKRPGPFQKIFLFNSIPKTWLFTGSVRRRLMPLVIF